MTPTPYGAARTADGRARPRSGCARRCSGRRAAQVVVGVLLAALGFAAITQVRTNTTDNSYAGYREQDLVNVLSGLAGTSQRAQQEINRLEATAAAARGRTSRRRAPPSPRPRSRSRSSASWPGAVPVTGPGIRVTVTEGPQHVDVDAVLDTIEELRSAGAEAMQVNGKVRLVAQSSVQATPSGLEIDGRPADVAVRLRRDRRPPHPAGCAHPESTDRSRSSRTPAPPSTSQELKALDITAVHKRAASQFAQPN